MGPALHRVLQCRRGSTLGIRLLATGGNVAAERLVDGGGEAVVFTLANDEMTGVVPLFCQMRAIRTRYVHFELFAFSPISPHLATMLLCCTTG
jgi:hypothetical protein